VVTRVLAAAATGRLVLVPNTLDQAVLAAQPAGAAPTADLSDTLPLGVLRVAAALQFWVAETPKVARALLKRVDAVVPLGRPLQDIVIAELPRPRKGQSLPAAADARQGAADPWAALLTPALQGHDIGLLSDAGLPAVADPGAELVRAAHQVGIAVVPLAGPSALLLALAASGLNGQSFAFQGYLPVEASERTRRLQELEAHARRWKQTQIFIETPYRNPALLAALLAALQPQTQLSVSCGLTTATGWSRTLKVSEWRKAAVDIPVDTPAVFSFLA
jgi:16S rRNA (cytidine1402-2'-O)-methyltransferase